MGDESPSIQNWLNIGNDLRIVLGCPLVESTDRYPTEEELNGYEGILPGARRRLEAMAYGEMRHRLAMEKLKSTTPVFPRLVFGDGFSCLI